MDILQKACLPTAKQMDSSQTIREIKNNAAPQSTLAAGTTNALNLPIPLSVPYGGTNTTSYTAGSVIFANATGASLTQNNSNFFWDNTNIRLSIGSTAPTNVLAVSGSTNPLCVYQNTAATATTTMSSYLVPNLTAGTNQVSLEIGVARSSNNAATLSFTYGAVGSSSANLVGLGLFGSNNLLTLNGVGDANLTTGNLLISTANKGLQIKSAAVSGSTANAMLVTGIVLPAGGSTVISNAAVTTSHYGFVTRTVAAFSLLGSVGSYTLLTGSGNFTITSSSGSDLSTLTVLLVKAL